MRAYQIESHTGLEALKLKHFDDPAPQPMEVVVRMRAYSLNYRDLSMPNGGYAGNNKVPLVPLSDGSGEVVAVGKGVTRFCVGDRVCGCFFTDWISGDLTASMMSSALGGAIDGVLAEYVRFPERGLVYIPEDLTFEQAACLPCAAVTAWQALTLANLRPGQTVLMLGTGGVSTFACQFAQAFGARTIVTSSSDEKRRRASDLGAWATINYLETPDWHEQVLDLTDGVGVDNVIEVGGAGTLEQSLAAARVSGTVSLIGVLTGRAPNPSPLLALFRRLTIRGIYVGSRDMFEAMNLAINANRIRPVVDTVFPFEQAVDAYRYLQSAGHFGKVVITGSI